MVLFPDGDIFTHIFYVMLAAIWTSMKRRCNYENESLNGFLCHPLYNTRIHRTSINTQTLYGHTKYPFLMMISSRVWLSLQDYMPLIQHYCHVLATLRLFSHSIFVTHLPHAPEKLPAYTSNRFMCLSYQMGAKKIATVWRNTSVLPFFALWNHAANCAST